ncbi:TFIID-18kDa-domain-containing protein [Aureobasidium pullulans]|uniref:Transcription initiation factor TFIID subunit 13 n=4 Tax=Aureobasidium TaxID=5579 RepID=A0A4T0C5Y6_AURPU|nr:TFIID-18kDa-domain-containing protein [Aureobasidium pullulans]
MLHCITTRPLFYNYHNPHHSNTMAEPRMRLRQKGQQFSNPELAGLLEAFGDTQPLPATLTTLDEIITDFIIETCHSAAICASYSRRQKIKVDDFKWVLRRDAKKLGRVTEIFFAEKILKDNRKAFDIGTGEGLVQGKKGAVKELGVEEEGEEGGRKRKKRKTEA